MHCTTVLHYCTALIHCANALDYYTALLYCITALHYYTALCAPLSPRFRQLEAVLTLCVFHKILKCKLQNEHSYSEHLGALPGIPTGLGETQSLWARGVTSEVDQVGLEPVWSPALAVRLFQFSTL
jgi:hypothetical protein